MTHRRTNISLLRAPFLRRLTGATFSIFLMLLGVFISVPVSANGISDSIQRQLKQLDDCIAQRPAFDRQKNQRIAKLRRQFHKTATPEQKYLVLGKLFNEYQSYQYDSAYAYATKMIDVAQQLGSADYRVESHCNLVFCLLSAGLYKEAFETLNAIDTTGASDPYMMIYYMQSSRLYYDMGDYVLAQPYTQTYLNEGNRNQAQALRLTQPKSKLWYYLVAQRQMKNRQLAQGIASFEHLLQMKPSTHYRAIVESCIGYMYRLQGKEEEAMHHLIFSAMADCESSTKETTALCMLAEMLYNKGDIERATHYVQLSLDDANFYGARLRKIEVGEILPIIEHKNYEILEDNQHWLVAGILLALLLVAVLLVAIAIFIRQKRSLVAARKVITERNHQLEQTNLQLNEANKIKDQFIGNTFYYNGEQIDKIEKLYRTIDRRLATKQYESLRGMLSETTLKKERDNMFEAFDATFLKIFPTFVNDYNALFPESERKVPREGSLTNEMRIFALIRLGISQSERIAKFLNYSVNTINTYKTRIKNKSIVDNDEFEIRIMNIGTF